MQGNDGDPSPPGRDHRSDWFVWCRWDDCEWHDYRVSKANARSLGNAHRAKQHGGVGSFALQKIGRPEFVYGSFGGRLDE